MFQPGYMRPSISAGAALLLLASGLFAQGGGIPYDKHQQWFFYSADHAVNSKWGLHFDGSWRQMNHSLWNQWNIRPGVNYQLNRRVQLSAAYAYFNSHPEGLASANRSFPEHRLQEQALVSQSLGILPVRHRVRFDQRFLGSGYSAWRERNWHLQYRLRYMLRTEVPLLKTKDERPAVYLGLYDEVFLRFKDAGASTFEQNRLYAGIGVRPSKRFGIETGVFNQRFKPVVGGRLENNYVLVVTVANQVPLKELLRRRPNGHRSRPAND